MPFSRCTPQKALFYAIATPFPLAPVPEFFQNREKVDAITLHCNLFPEQKRGRPAWDALLKSDLFRSVSVPGAQPATEKTYCKQRKNHAIASPVQASTHCPRPIYAAVTCLESLVNHFFSLAITSFANPISCIAADTWRDVVRL